MPRKLTLTRDVSKAECPWLEINLKSGSCVYEYTDHTFGCVDAMKGIACTWMPNEPPFFEVPRDAVSGLKPELTLTELSKIIAGEMEAPEGFYDDAPRPPDPKSVRKWKRQAAKARSMRPRKRKKVEEPVEIQAVDW